MHLLGADIVNRDNEDGLVLVEQALELVEVDGFGSRFAPHISFGVELGCLRANLVGGLEVVVRFDLSNRIHFFASCGRNSGPQRQDH